MLVTLITMMVTSQFVASVQAHRVIQQSQEQVAQSLEDMRSLAESFGKSVMSLRSPLNDDMIAGAETVCLMGISLSRTLLNHWGSLRERVIHGANLTIVLVDWKNPHIEREYCDRYLASYNKGERRRKYRGRFDSVEDSINRIKSNLPARSGTVTVIKSPFFPACGITLLDPRQKSCRGFYELYLNRLDGFQPHFTLNSDSGKILDMVYSEFDAVANIQIQEAEESSADPDGSKT
ncbi:hypothetical protein [Nocardia sp. NPDC049149]|uniref:hypothetical protein n=1 Tax=Nocardia sp. NPDC049149 TaxID=3364315 RepID=UPI00370FFE19